MPEQRHVRLFRNGRNQAVRIGSNDLLIAAHAYATGVTIVTANAAEFKPISGLKVENWLD
jgi:predicted nucleic acid-binding protein